ncbi:hypothetical protein CDAR_73551 [Caerostris darwini]|uniref:Uncharacterized protein n=1 Tax=Caerostris darwini TaxID=1538125 RepID=A0AAV4VL21_9ARAC|nr:hypothetical protein CDAR_73551 [Caerostris darwini]
MYAERNIVQFPVDSKRDSEPLQVRSKEKPKKHFQKMRVQEENQEIGLCKGKQQIQRQSRRNDTRSVQRKKQNLPSCNLEDRSASATVIPISLEEGCGVKGPPATWTHYVRCSTYRSRFLSHRDIDSNIDQDKTRKREKGKISPKGRKLTVVDR